MIDDLQDKTMLRLGGNQAFHVLLDVVDQAVQREESQRRGNDLIGPG